MKKTFSVMVATGAMATGALLTGPLPAQAAASPSLTVTVKDTGTPVYCSFSLANRGLTPLSQYFLTVYNEAQGSGYMVDFTTDSRGAFKGDIPGEMYDDIINSNNQLTTILYDSAMHPVLHKSRIVNRCTP